MRTSVPSPNGLRACSENPSASFRRLPLTYSWRNRNPGTRTRHTIDEPDRGGSTALLLHHVKAFDVSYWDWQKQEWVRDWSTAPGDRTLLPARVRMKLTLRMPDGTERSFETQTRIQILRPLDF